MTVGKVAVGQARKKIETLALCLSWLCSSFLLKGVQAVQTVSVTVGAKVLLGGIPS